MCAAGLLLVCKTKCGFLVCLQKPKNKDWEDFGGRSNWEEKKYNNPPQTTAIREASEETNYIFASHPPKNSTRVKRVEFMENLKTDPTIVNTSYSFLTKKILSKPVYIPIGKYYSYIALLSPEEMQRSMKMGDFEFTDSVTRKFEWFSWEDFSVKLKNGECHVRLGNRADEYWEILSNYLLLNPG